MKIVVLDGHTLNPGDNPWDPVAALGELTVYDRTPADCVVRRARGARVVLTNKTPLSAETLSALPELELVSILATGYEVVDVAAARRLSITVCNVPDYATESVAEHTLALLLELTRQVGRHDRLVREGVWAASGHFSLWETSPVELAGKTIGIVGLGRIGRRVAELAAAFGMNVVATGPRPHPVPAGGRWTDDLDELLAEADIVTLHCPLTEETRNLLDRKRLARMKPGALLINTARGGLVDERALAEVLRSGHLGGAALDVVSREPLAASDPLLGAPRLIVTPHMAWASLAARQRLMKQTAENIRAFLRGRPVNVVS